MATDPDNFSSLFEFLPIGAYRVSPNGRQLRANPALVRLNGFDSEAEHLAAVTDIATEWYVDPTRRAEFAARLDRDGQLTGFESEVCRYKTRERIWISENAHVVRDAAGQVLFYEGTVEDITERVRARQAMERSEENLRQVAAHVPGALYRLVLHPDGRSEIDYISKGVVALLGLEPAEVMRQQGALRRLRHPDDRDRVTELVQHANANATVLLTEYRVLLADGQQKWIQQTSSPISQDRDGRTVRIGVLLDITERKLADARLKASEARWRLALDSVGDGVWDWNLLTGEETLSRRCLEMYGYAEGELAPEVGALDALTHPHDIGAMRRARDAHIAGETGTYRNEHRVRCRDGSWKWVLSRGLIIERDADGKPLRMIGTHTDVTAARQAEALRAERDRAAAADRAKSQFLSRVSHELRTPLNAILGFTQLLELDPGDGPRQRGWIQQVLDSGNHLLGLMDDILDLSSAQTGQLPHTIQVLPLWPVLQDARAMFDGVAAEAGVVIDIRAVAGDTLTVRADRKRLKQVLSNLLSNAVKYNRRGGWVRVDAEVRGDEVELRISDSGVGLDASQLSRLFNPFERAGAQHGPVAGTGLGLALTRQLVEAMGGSVGATSRPDHGSTFTVRLPRG